MSDFKGKTAIVTGGGSGLGEAISKDLAKNGVNVVVVDINRDAATRVSNEITAAGGTAVPFQGNTAVAEDSKKAVDFAVSRYGALNYAVNNAGIGGANAPVGDLDVEDWDRVIAINLSGSSTECATRSGHPCRRCLRRCHREHGVDPRRRRCSRQRRLHRGQARRRGPDQECCG
ncbi:glucose 1-dehydrogenase [Arthrobacter sp. Hiyo8]|nr:glucose 1-dehydrogenase [Arthrobacter sp. Hiyo8]